jgi:TRAP transporter TAXI family solute receptor
MKKRFIPVFTITVLSGFILAATEEGARAQQIKPESWPKILTIATSPQGSTGYFFAAALGKRIEDKLGIPVTITVSIGAAAARLVAKGEAEFGIPNNVNFYTAVRGTGVFSKEGKLPLRYVTFTYPLFNHLMARKEIDSFPKLKGKRAMFDYPTAPQFMAEVDALLKFHGMTRNDLILLKSTGGGDVSDALIAGTVDAGMRGGSVGAPAIKDTATKADLTFISLSDAEAQFVDKEAPFLEPATIPAGTYKGQDRPVKTVSLGTNLVARSDVPEDLVYEIAKILMDSVGKDTPGDFTQYHKALRYTLQDNVNQLYRRIGPFHPGVIKYLKERGVWTADMDRIQAELLELTK